MPVIQPNLRRVLYWADAGQPLDFTKDDVAAFTAAALGDAAPRFLRIAGETLRAREVATAMSGVTGNRYCPLCAGGLGLLGVMIGVAKRVVPQAQATFPA